MNRFFLSPDQIHDLEVHFPVDVSHQIARVLRLKEKDRVTILDNSGNQYLAELISVDPKDCRAAVIEITDQPTAELASMMLFISLTQRDKFEWILQKGTEIGVSGFYPVVTQRCLVQSTQQWEKKTRRWQQIIREAAEQSGCIRMPVLHTPLPYLDAVALAKTNVDLAVIAWEGETELSLGALLRERLPGMRSPSVGVFIGPEGGFTSAEIDQARLDKITPVTLGKKILRMETAAIVSVSIVLYELGKIG